MNSLKKLPENTFLQGQYLAENTISSADDLVARIEDFAKKLSLGQIGRFTCTCPLDNFYTFSVELKSFGEVWRPTFPHLFTYTNVVELEKKDDLNENYFFAEQIDYGSKSIKESETLTKNLSEKDIVVAKNLGVSYAINGRLPKNFDFQNNVYRKVRSIAEENYPLQNRLSLESTKTLAPAVGFLFLAIAARIYMEQF